MTNFKMGELESQLEKALECGMNGDEDYDEDDIAQCCDEIVHDFMNDNFGQFWYKKNDSLCTAMMFYEEVAAPCRTEAINKRLEKIQTLSTT